MNLNDTFIGDLVQIEAKDLLSDLKKYYLHVILIPAPDPKFEGHKIRVSDNRNPEWYQELYNRYPALKRNHTKKSLNRFIENNLNVESVYDIMLLDLILNRLGVDKNDFFGT